MKKLFTMILLLAVMGVKAQTAADRQQPKASPAKTEAVILRNSSLEIKRGDGADSLNIYPKMSNGNNWVMQYSYQAPEYAEISDDEYIETFNFMIPVQKGTAFQLRDSAALTGAATIFQKSCFCADRGYFIIKHGSISGKKISSNTWLVTVDVMVPAKGELSVAHRKKFTARYKLPPLK